VLRPDALSGALSAALITLAEFRGTSPAPEYIAIERGVR
jgi:hypothetical protein